MFKMVLLALLVVISVSRAIAENSLLRNNENQVTCVSAESVPLCAELGYVNTTFPNLRGHTTPEEANKELAHFSALIYTGCSNAIVHLLCSIYAPVCIQEYPDFIYPPCKNLCEYVKNDCAATLLQTFGINWPPGPHLDCHNYQTVEQNRLCYGPSDPSIIKLPPFVEYPDPPENLTANPLSPSTVDFSWDAPEDSEDETYILTCEPQPYKFPLTTSETSLRARNFHSDTNYTCTVLRAHTAITQNSTAVVEFKTPEQGPPRNIAVGQVSTTCAEVSWSYPDSELPRVHSQSYLYMITCHSQENDHQEVVRGESIFLDNLHPGTEYSCRVSLFSKEQMAMINFTTLEPLQLQFTNDTPDIENNTVRLQFNTNRPAAKIICRILNQGEKQNCSDQQAVFQNISAGTRTLRIVAENSRKDRLVLKIKLYISGSNAHSCAVNLINKRIFQTGNSVLIYFKGTNSADQFKCSLNKQSYFRCYSPLFLRRLEEGSHQVKIVPTSRQCRQRTSLMTEFTIT